MPSKIKPHERLPKKETNTGLISSLKLLKKVKQGIKQKCYIDLSEADRDVSSTGLRIRIITKNHKTNENMYFQTIITEEELILLEESFFDRIINKLIVDANDHFRKEQS